MVAAASALSVGSPTKFSGPNDQRVLQHASLFEVSKQSRDRLIRFGAAFRQLVLDEKMVIPLGRSRDLDKPDSGFGQSASQNALPREAVGRHACPHSVQLQRRLCLGPDVENLRYLILHPEGQFKRLDGPFNFRVVDISTELLLVESANQVELFSLQPFRQEFIRDVFQWRPRLLIFAEQRRIERRNLVAANACSLADRRQKRAAVVAGSTIVGRRVDRDKTRQVLVLCAEAVQSPGSDRWPHKLKTSGMHLREGLRVIWQVGMHAVNHAQVVGLAGEVRKDFGKPQPRLAMLSELER